MALVGVSSLVVLTAACGSKPSVQEGRTLYAENGCASCHGVGGDGNGPVAASLEVRPTDFHNPKAFVKGADEDAIAQTLLDGIAIHRLRTTKQIPHHQLVMPRFDHLSEWERRSIALYVISMRNKQ